MTRTVLQVYRAAKACEADLYHFHDPELIPVGLALARKGTKVVYDVHEAVREQAMAKDWLPGPLRLPVYLGVASAEALAARTFDRIVAATPAIGDQFPSDRTVVIQNFPEALGERVEEGEPYQDRPNRIVYIGGVSTRRGAQEMVDAMAALPDGLDAELLVMGMYRPPGLRQALQKRQGGKRSRFMKWKPREEALEALGASRIGIALYHPGPNHDESQPTKLFEYMRAGIPVVASNLPHWRAIIEDSRSGICVDPEDPEDVASAIAWLLNHPKEAKDMGRNGQEAARDRFNWEAESQKLLTLYDELFVRHPHGRHSLGPGPGGGP